MSSCIVILLFLNLLIIKWLIIKLHSFSIIGKHGYPHSSYLYLDQ